MSRLKMLSVLAGTIAMLALSAAPASAIWESNNGQTTGTVKVLATGEFTYATGAFVKCPNTAEVKAQWQIQGAGQIKEQQKITTKGPHLQIQVKAWGKCEATVGTTKLPATVSECDFQLVQQTGLSATGGVSKQPCVITAEPCKIQVPIGMEKTQNSGTGINVGLKTITLSNVNTKNQLDEVNITEGGEAQGGKGVFAQSTSGNPLCPLAGSSATGTLTGLKFEAEEVKVV